MKESQAELIGDTYVGGVMNFGDVPLSDRGKDEMFYDWVVSLSRAGVDEKVLASKARKQLSKSGGPSSHVE